MKELLFIICFLFSSSAFAQQSADEAELRRLKTIDWPRAYREGDTALLARILADEFQLIDAAGEVSDKKAELAYIQKHKPTYTFFVYTINRLDVFENGTAVVAGIGLMKGSDSKGPYQISYHSSNVLIKRAGRWQAIASHVSGVKRE